MPKMITIWMSTESTNDTCIRACRPRTAMRRSVITSYSIHYTKLYEVVLSHRNILGNIRQVSDVLDTREEDVVMTSLPLFHAFGLTVTGLMPMVEGMPAIWRSIWAGLTA